MNIGKATQPGLTPRLILRLEISPVVSIGVVFVPLAVGGAGWRPAWGEGFWLGIGGREGQVSKWRCFVGENGLLTYLLKLTKLVIFDDGKTNPIM